MVGTIKRKDGRAQGCYCARHRGCRIVAGHRLAARGGPTAVSGLCEQPSVQAWPSGGAGAAHCRLRHRTLKQWTKTKLPALRMSGEPVCVTRGRAELSTRSSYAAATRRIVVTASHWLSVLRSGDPRRSVSLSSVQVPYRGACTHMHGCLPCPVGRQCSRLKPQRRRVTAAERKDMAAERRGHAQRGSTSCMNTLP